MINFPHLRKFNTVCSLSLVKNTAFNFVVLFLLFGRATFDVYVEWVAFKDLEKLSPIPCLAFLSTRLEMAYSLITSKFKLLLNNDKETSGCFDTPCLQLITAYGRYISVYFKKFQTQTLLLNKRDHVMRRRDLFLRIKKIKFWLQH